MKKLIILLIALVSIISLAMSKNGSDSRMKSYDTTYVDERDSSLLMRQIYMDDLFNRKEIYILYRMRGDSIVKRYRWETKYY